MTVSSVGRALVLSFSYCCLTMVRVKASACCNFRSITSGNRTWEYSPIPESKTHPTTIEFQPPHQHKKCNFGVFPFQSTGLATGLHIVNGREHILTDTIMCSPVIDQPCWCVKIFDLFAGCDWFDRQLTFSVAQKLVFHPYRVSCIAEQKSR